MISKKEYKELKAYWDFQRKIEYNKEMMKKEIDSSEESYNIEILEKDELFDYMWSEMDQEDYQDPPKFWIPLNEKYQIEGESERKNIKRRK